MAWHQSALRHLVVVLVAIEVPGHLIDDSDQVDDGAIVDGEIVRIDGGEIPSAKGGRSISLRRGVGDARRIQTAWVSGGRIIQEKGIDEAVVYIGDVGSADIVDEANIGSELERVFAA